MKFLNGLIVLAGLVLLMIGKIAYAETIVIYPNTVISYPRTYENVTLDLSRGSFIIKENVKLTIKNCNIVGTLSPTNPILFSIEKGSLDMSGTQVNVTTADIAPHDMTQSLQYVVSVNQGKVFLTNNNFKIDKNFTAGFMITNASIPTSGFQITNNTFEKFHGVLYLLASDSALISDNVLTKNSYGHIVIMGNNTKITHNTISFSGYNRLGDAIDLIDASNITINKNILLTPTCHGIYVLNSHDLLIDSNRIFGGITYAMNIYTYPETSYAEKDVKAILPNHKMQNLISNNITISNNVMSQNRYGIASSDTDNLVVKNNYFVQRFEDNDSRVFWTNNSILLKNVTNLTWTNNLYKEAYTQAINGDNSHSNQFVVFPATGGVSFS